MCACLKVKEMGVLAMDCECLAQDAEQLFAIYWNLTSPTAYIPQPWPTQYNAMYNLTNPAIISLNDTPAMAYWSVSLIDVCLCMSCVGIIQQHNTVIWEAMYSVGQMSLRILLCIKCLFVIYTTLLLSLPPSLPPSLPSFSCFFPVFSSSILCSVSHTRPHSFTTCH